MHQARKLVEWTIPQRLNLVRISRESLANLLRISRQSLANLVRTASPVVPRRLAGYSPEIAV